MMFREQLGRTHARLGYLAIKTCEMEVKRLVRQKNQKGSKTVSNTFHSFNLFLSKFLFDLQLKSRGSVASASLRLPVYVALGRERTDSGDV